MGEIVLAVVIAAWVAEALVLGYVMGRRGYDAYSWTLIGVVFGPISLAIATSLAFRSPPRDARLLHTGNAGSGSVDVLVGVDGSPESEAAIRQVGVLFGEAVGRITFAHVVPIDATPETETAAEAQLAAACSAHPELDPSTVVLRGKPVDALRDYVTQLGYEVLVVGTRGTGKSTAILGSVATGLARRAGVPVLLVDK